MKFIFKVLVLSILSACILSITIIPKELRKTNINSDQSDQVTQVATNNQNTQAAASSSSSSSNSSTSPSLITGSDSKVDDTSVKKDLGNGFVRPAMVPEGTLPLQNNWDAKRKRFE